MSLPFFCDASIRLIQCAPPPDVIGHEPFDTLINGIRVMTRPLAVCGLNLHIPRGIIWHPEGWVVRWQRNFRITQKFVKVLRGESPLPALQVAWQILTKGLGTISRNYAPLSTNSLRTIYKGVYSTLSHKAGHHYVVMSVHYPIKGGRFHQINKTLGNINDVTRKGYDAHFRQTVALRQYIEHCMRAGYYVDRITWDSPVPVPKRITVKPSLGELRTEASRRSLELMWKSR